jgi:hypothetical protein
MSERNRPAEGQREKAGQTGQNDQKQQDQSTEEKSTVDKMIDKGQEKGLLTEKVANMIRGKLRSR